MQRPDNGTLELSKFYTWMGDDGIARTMVKPGVEVYLKDAKENTEAVRSFYNGKKLALLVDIREIKSISVEAREHFSLKNRESPVKVYAMLIDSTLSRMLGNYFLKFHKPAVPVKLFNDQEKALIWLKEF